MAACLVLSRIASSLHVRGQSVGTDCDSVTAKARSARRDGEDLFRAEGPSLASRPKEPCSQTYSPWWSHRVALNSNNSRRP